MGLFRNRSEGVTLRPEGNWLPIELRKQGEYAYETPLVSLNYEGHGWIKGRILGGVEGQATQFEEWKASGKRVMCTIYDQWIFEIRVLEHHVES